MNATRIMTTLATAAALVGGIGLAYAQTATDSTQPPASTDSTYVKPVAPAADTGSMKSDSTAMPNSSSSDSSAMPATTNTESTPAQTERAPKADRG